RPQRCIVLALYEKFGNLQKLRPLTRRAACIGPAAEDCRKRGDYGRINDFCVAADRVTNNCQASWAVSAAWGPPSLPDLALRSRRLMIAIALSERVFNSTSSRGCGRAGRDNASR